jgi:hypothetical protein
VSNITISGTAVPPSTVNTVTFSATPVFNAALGMAQKLTLTGNVTSSTFTNGVVGLYEFILIQDATGGRTFVWPANFFGAQVPDLGISVRSTQIFLFDGTNAIAFGDQVTT